MGPKTDYLQNQIDVKAYCFTKFRGDSQTNKGKTISSN